MQIRLQLTRWRSKLSNLRIILEKLNLQDVKFFAAYDLKCANPVFGLSGHGAKRACGVKSVKGVCGVKRNEGCGKLFEI